MSTTSRSILYLGLDVHKDSVTIAVLPAAAATPTQSLKVPHDLRKLKRHFARLVQDAGADVELRCVYEASGAGYVLQRAMLEWGYHCDVCAPSLTPTRPGYRRKHDRYDAKQLAHYYRSGDLTLIAIPTEAEESARDLVRCRTSFQRTLHRARQRVLKFCTRHGLRFVPTGPRKSSAPPRHWTKGHRAWLAQLISSRTVVGTDATVLGEYLAHMTYAEDRRDALDLELEQLALTPALAAAVRTLSAFRGIETKAALVLATEIRDWQRFAKPTELMAYLGLVPREDSSGDAERKGGITKAGNSHCRHVLVQAAHTYRHEPRVGRALKARQAAVGSAAVAVCSWKAQHRLHQVYRHLAARRGVNVAVVAVARELVGFLWAVMAGPMAPAAPGTSRSAA
jgi:transposase